MKPRGAGLHAKLRPKWKPGESGNPSGKSKGDVQLTPAVKKYLREHPEKVKMFVESWVEHALEEVGAREQILERIEGKVADQLKLSGTIQITVVYEDAPGSGAGLDVEQREHRGTPK